MRGERKERDQSIDDRHCDGREGGREGMIRLDGKKADGGIEDNNKRQVCY